MVTSRTVNRIRGVNDSIQIQIWCCPITPMVMIKDVRDSIIPSLRGAPDMVIYEFIPTDLIIATGTQGDTKPGIVIKRVVSKLVIGGSG